MDFLITNEKILENFTIKEIAEITNAKTFGYSHNRVIQSFLTDSRQLTDPENTLFFAWKGKRQDGHRYIQSLYEKGVRAFFTEKKVDVNEYPDAVFLSSENIIDSLQKIAAHYRQQFNFPVIAITGSNGKTIVKEWLNFILSSFYTISRSPASYNSQTGVPLSVLKTNNTHNLGIFEAGISQTGEMEKLENILKPKIGVLTNIGSAHDSGFKSLKEKAAEKMQLFKGSETFIYCSDYAVIEETPFLKNFRGSVIDWSMQRKGAYFAEIKKIPNNQLKISAAAHDDKIEVVIPFCDAASAENAIHTLYVCYTLGLWNEKKLKELFSALPQLKMRLEIREGKNNNVLIDDSYNNDLTALLIALDYAKSQRQKQLHTLILSDLTEDSQKPEIVYKEILRVLEAKEIDKFIAIGDKWSTFLKKHTEKYPFKVSVFQEVQSFLQSAEANAINDSCVLIKGARKYQFEKITSFFQKQVHRTRLEINLDNLAHNLNYFQTLVPADTKLMVMVKALGYGSGAEEISSFLEWQGIHYLAVAYTDEGINLKKQNIKLPIMVMSPDYDALESVIAYRLEPELYSFEVLNEFEKKLEDMLVYEDIPLPYPVHIKIDTGMHRLGFMPEETEKLSKRIQKKKLLKIQSVFSHLSAADNPEKKEFTRTQLSVFENACADIRKTYPHPFLMHILNSSGISFYPEKAYDMVRLGIGLYGFDSNELHYKNLKNVHALKTSVLQVKNLKKDSSIGYTGENYLRKDSKIATIAIGYADGFNRLLGNGNWQVLIKNQFCPTIGNICMDMAMVDVTNVEDVEVGDEVIVFENREAILKMASQNHTIPYEVLTSLSPRIKRVYLKE
ncbi:MAG: bifunctional UDP-N-acetylmuramoyl-tripeptide:D-alanyl-D-alanine ligase/alanine racemase [Chitinophagaceae bacterium]|nr:MAG: bifunctional UDP-N-acetylmuramoyl-tripeptide:D-alanyl-D-alanine ligase/alanine racemase [Chitinophagaceae bacterium]